LADLQRTVYPHKWSAISERYGFAPKCHNFVSLFFSVLFCFYTLLFQCIVPLIKPPLVNLMLCHPRATCYIAECCHLANSITCYLRATCHVAGCCRLANSMSCHPKAKQRGVGLMDFGMCLYAHLNLQTKNKQSHVSYCRLQKCHLPFENRSSPYIRDEY